MSEPNIQVHGSVALGFESVRELFASNFQAGKEGNAQLCVYVGEEKVVDLWGTSSGDTSYDGDSLQNVFSSTKSVTAIAIATLVDKKLIKYDDKVAQHWPEFAQNGKEDITLEKILRHEGGMAWFNHTFKMEDLLTENIKKNAIGKVIEKEHLRFPPTEAGTTREYHGLTRGWILNEVFRRVDPQGRTIGEWLREDVSDALGADVYVGLKDEELDRVCDLGAWTTRSVFLQSMIPQFLGRKIDLNVFDILQFALTMRRFKNGEKPPALEVFDKNDDAPTQVKKFNRVEMRRGEVPSANGHCSARGLAKLAAVMASKGELNGVRLMSEETWALMHSHLEKKPDHAFLGAATKFSQGGINLYSVYEENPDRVKIVQKKRENFFGWGGIGGSVFQWYPDLQIGFSYVPALAAWYDFLNTKAAMLQNEVVECVLRKSQNSKD